MKITYKFEMRIFFAPLVPAVVVRFATRRPRCFYNQIFLPTTATSVLLLLLLLLLLPLLLDETNSALGRLLPVGPFKRQSKNASIRYLPKKRGGEICFILKSFDFHFAYVATSSSSMVEIFFSKRPMTKEYFQQFRTKEKLLARLEWIDLCIRCQTLSAQCRQVSTADCRDWNGMTLFLPTFAGLSRDNFHSFTCLLEKYSLYLFE
ncbi:hypothetical protein T08_15908 [Trichinella sp. T8]|nr:hypothetical protein T08_15908 [Trichinella sp. T8]